MTRIDANTCDWKRQGPGIRRQETRVRRGLRRDSGFQGANLENVLRFASSRFKGAIVQCSQFTHPEKRGQRQSFRSLTVYLYR